MLEYDFLKNLNEYVRIYKELLLPVVICDRTLEVYWSNSAAKSLYPHLTDADGVRVMLEEFDSEGLFSKMGQEGTLRIDGALSLSGAQANLIPILHGGEVGGAVVLIAGAASAINSADVIESSKTPIALESSIRESVETMFRAMDVAALKADALGSGWVKGTLNSIAQSGYHILRIASNISYYSRFQAEPPGNIANTIDIFDLLRQSKPAVDALSAEMAIPVEYALPNEPGFSPVEAALFQAAFFNILHNAFYFTKQGNSVAITGENKDGEIILSLTDKGMGIPEEIMPDIFKPYFSRGHGGKAAGTGLGLSVSKTIIEAAGGKLEIQSVLGEGTKAVITLREGPFSRRVSFAQGTGALDCSDRFSSVYVGLCDAKSSPYREDR